MAWISGDTLDAAQEARQWRVNRLMQHIARYG